MKKSKRPIVLNLENLETRVVPSQAQGLLEPHHVLGVDSAITAELETPKGDNGNHTSQESDIGKIKMSTEDITSASFDNADHLGRSDAENHSDSNPDNSNSNHADKSKISADDMTSATLENVDHHGPSDEANPSDSNHTDNANSNHADRTEKNSDNDSSISSTLSDTPTREVESSASHLADSVKSEVAKSDHDSEKSKSENNSSSDIGSVSSGNSSGNSQSNLDSGKGSKSEDTSSKNGTGSKSNSSNSSSSSSSSSSSLTDNDSTSVVSTTSQGLGSATGSSPTKVVHGKSQSDHKDSTGDSNSTDTTVVAGNQQSASEGIADPMISSSLRQASFAESNLGKSAAESSNTGVLGAQLGIDANTASIASTAAVLSANEALVHVPAVVDAAIPLAIPVLQSFAPSLGLGELAAMDTLAPVAGDLIVGFLPVEQMNLASAMQGVLSEIETLGEQMVGSAAGKWLYPFVFTALAATTVFQLATRRRRRVQRQSVWASESGIWSGSYFGRP